jgi:hemerythrin superfamily protein
MATTAQKVGAVELLKEDHSKVKELFKEFEGAADQLSKQDIARKCFQELKVHAAVEEEIFYPAVEDAADAEDEVAHSREEHQKVKDSIAELENLSMGGEFDTKFRVMAENVRHHIEEEEGKMFPQAEVSGIDLVELGEEMSSRKSELEGAAARPRARRKPQAGRKGRAHSRARAR